MRAPTSADGAEAAAPLGVPPVRPAAVDSATRVRAPSRRSRSPWPCCSCSAPAAGTAITGGPPAAIWSRPTTPMWAPRTRRSRPRSSGYVVRVTVDDNAHVHAGDVIARIDDGDYRLAVETARDKVATQQATVDRIGRQVAAQQAAVDQAKAQLVSAQAGATRAELEFERQQRLAAQRLCQPARRSSRRWPTAIRPLPPCRARRRPSTPRRPMSTCSRRSRTKPTRSSTSSKRRSPRPSAICRSR